MEKLEDDVEEIYKSEIIDTEDLNSSTHVESQESAPDQISSISTETIKENSSASIKSETKNVSIEEISINEDYIIPTDFLHTSKEQSTENWKSEISKNSELLVNALADFGIESNVINVNRGPVITLYELQIAPGIKVNKIVGLADDIAMALAALRVRIVAPIPGKSAIGVEIPNGKREIVTLGDVLSSDVFHSQTGYLNVALGKDILGHPVTLDLKTLPHLLIAGATGSGKSVCVNSIITSLIYNYDPEYLKFILVDPKMVELQVYNGLPHLLTPVITESKKAQVALKWVIYEMERRYRLLSECNCRNIERYNNQTESLFEVEKLPYIVTIIDELADLIMVATKEVEGYITRIAQKARAVGIHLVLATQRPSVDVITGIIKANFPARIAFQVAQKTDSRTILDQNGAEKLLGQGDLLYQSPISSFPIRIQGTYVSEDEILNIVNHLGKKYRPQYIDISESVEETEEQIAENSDGDELFVEALKIVEETRKASASYLQRRLSIGYNRAARIIELMEDRGYVGPQQGSKPREVFI
jgi:S-DNA-T family DNA segregation ATPase FtsK/SpoIIIE